jgi:hypothetical protein
MGREIGRLVVESLMQKTSVAENPLTIIAPASARASDGR